MYIKAQKCWVINHNYRLSILWMVGEFYFLWIYFGNMSLWRKKLLMLQFQRWIFDPKNEALHCWISADTLGESKHLWYPILQQMAEIDIKVISLSEMYNLIQAWVQMLMISVLNQCIYLYTGRQHVVHITIFYIIPLFIHI